MAADKPRREAPREKMKRYYLKRKKAGRRPGPKPPPALKIEGDPFGAFTHFLNTKPRGKSK